VLHNHAHTRTHIARLDQKQQKNHGHDIEHTQQNNKKQIKKQIKKTKKTSAMISSISNPCSTEPLLFAAACAHTLTSQCKKRPGVGAKRGLESVQKEAWYRAKEGWYKAKRS